MGKLACELCGSSDLIKSEGVFVCQSCGAKYSVEEARQMMFAGDNSTPAPAPESASAPSSGLQDLLLGLAGMFAQGQRLASPKTPAEINNYVCESWEHLLSEYKSIEHPTEEQHSEMVARAKECLGALDSVATENADDVVQAAVIYANCKQIVESVRDLRYHVQNDKGEWSKKGLSSFDKVALPKQSASWDEKYQEQHDFLVADYLRQNPDILEKRSALSQRESELSEQLGDLKDEKRGKGFFNFDGKREVKERMAPVKEELASVRSELRAIENAADKYVNQCIESMRGQFTLLDL